MKNLTRTAIQNNDERKVQEHKESNPFAVHPNFREIHSPLDKHQLRPLDPRCVRVQFKSPLTTIELLKLASFLDDYPDVELRVYGHHGISVPDLHFLYPLKNRKKISIGIWDLDTYSGIEMFSQNLESLSLEATKHKHSLSFLSNYPDLKKLYIENQSKQIETISQLKKLEKLTLRSITLKNIDFVTDLPNLWWIAIKLGGTKDLSVLGKLEQVKYVELWRILGFHDLEFVSLMKGLQFLFL